MGGLAIHERGDDVAQGRERQVDLRGLLEPVAARLGLGLALGARQVDEVELAHANVWRAIVVGGTGFDGDAVNGVGPRAVLIHGRRAHVAILGAKIPKLVALLGAFDDVGGQVAHIDARVGALLELELVGRVLREEVAHLLVVELQVGRTHQILGGVARALGDEVKDLCKGARDDAPKLLVVVDTFHGESFAGARLPVCKNGTIVALQNAVHNGRRRLLVQHLLCATRCVNPIKSEVLWRFVAAWGLHRAHASLLIHVDDHGAAILDLLLVERTAPNHDPHGLRRRRHGVHWRSLPGLRRQRREAAKAKWCWLPTEQAVVDARERELHTDRSFIGMHPGRKNIKPEFICNRLAERILAPCRLPGQQSKQDPSMLHRTVL